MLMGEHGTEGVDHRKSGKWCKIFAVMADVVAHRQCDVINVAAGDSVMCAVGTIPAMQLLDQINKKSTAVDWFFDHISGKNHPDAVSHTHDRKKAQHIFLK